MNDLTFRITVLKRWWFDCFILGAVNEIVTVVFVFVFHCLSWCHSDSCVYFDTEREGFLRRNLIEAHDTESFHPCDGRAKTVAEWPRAKAPAEGPFHKNKISRLITEIPKTPDAPAGPADSWTGLRLLITSLEENGRGGSTILEWAPSSRFSSRPTNSSVRIGSIPWSVALHLFFLESNVPGAR